MIAKLENSLVDNLCAVCLNKKIEIILPCMVVFQIAIKIVYSMDFAKNAAVNGLLKDKKTLVHYVGENTRSRNRNY